MTSRRNTIRPQRFGDWRLDGPLTAGHQHVQRAVGPRGLRGVLKQPRRPYGNDLARFHDEARNMQRLNGTRGVLPILDIDPGGKPLWFVMPEAQLLAEHLGDHPEFTSVVGAVARVAHTLADLLDGPDATAHRDIKPDNLFWNHGEATVGDFGIAAWPRRDNITQIGARLGAAHFLAPEMRSVPVDQPVGRASQGDVYALAKTFYVLCYPTRGPYPPPGQHDIDKDEFSLASAGDKAARDLGALMEAATDPAPSLRPTMGQFADELDSWLRQHPTPVPRRPGLRLGTSGWDPLEASLERYRRESKALFRQLRQAIRDLGAAEADDSVSLDEPPRAQQLPDGSWPTTIIGDYPELRYSDPDGPDHALIFSLEYPNQNDRLTVAGYLVTDDVLYIAEWQTREPASAGDSASRGPVGDRWTRRWGDCVTGTFRFPRTNERLADLFAVARREAPSPWPDGVPILARLR